jgi:choline dehydrogenase-like flavoprotein
VSEDARNVPANTEIVTDVCIVGAGAAGITLARELANSSIRVCLLESGTREMERPNQSLNDGANLGLPYYPLISSRLRMFGGTTNHWAGESRPLDPIDFEARPWIARSGWPLTRGELDPFYRRAQEICKLGPFDYRPHRWPSGTTPELILKDPGVVTTIFQRNRPVRFGREYANDLKRARNLRSFFYANVIDVEEDENRNAIARVRVATLSGNGFWVRARKFVLALGAIETTRLLLLSSTGKRRGYGRGDSVVGRYFSEHPYTEIGVLKPSRPWVANQLIERAVERVDGVGIVRAFTFAQEVLRREKLPNFQVFLEAVESPATASLRRLLSMFKQGELPDRLGEDIGRVLSNFDEASWQAANQETSDPENPTRWIRVSATFEPVPDPESRVVLLKRKDALGQARVGLRWQVDPGQKAALRRIARRMGTAFAASGLGRMRVTLDEDDTRWREPPKGSWHQMGTTRMHENARQGVVDSACRVHGLANLYIASGSVFPTVGYANPTLTIVALSVRMAQHLKRELA